MPKILKDEWVKCSWCEELINLKYINGSKRKYFRKFGKIYCSKKCSLIVLSKKAKEQWNDLEFRKKRSEKAKEQWNDLEFRKKRSEEIKERWNDPEFRKKRSEESKEQWNDNEYKKMMSENKKDMWKDNEFKQKRSEEVSKQVKKQIEKHGRACITDLQTNLQVVLGEKNWILEKSIHVPKNTHPLQTGYYYKADLMHCTLKLIIELDGKKHNTEKQKNHDKIRDEILTYMGYKILRFKNQEVEDDMSSCIDRIHSEMRKIQAYQF
jgi:very-short-patch-repair endonuclease